MQSSAHVHPSLYRALYKAMMDAASAPDLSEAERLQALERAYRIVAAFPELFPKVDTPPQKPQRTA